MTSNLILEIVISFQIDVTVTTFSQMKIITMDIVVNGAFLSCSHWTHLTLCIQILEFPKCFLFHSFSPLFYFGFGFLTLFFAPMHLTSFAFPDVPVWQANVVKVYAVLEDRHVL